MHTDQNKKRSTDDRQNDENLGDRLDAFYDTPKGRLIIMIIGVVVTVILIRLFD